MTKQLRTRMNQYHGFPSEETGATLYNWKLADADLTARKMWEGMESESLEARAFFTKVYGVTRCRAAGRPHNGRYLTFPWQVNPTPMVEFDEFRELTGGTAILSDEFGVSGGFTVREGRDLDYLEGYVDEDPEPWW